METLKDSRRTVDANEKERSMKEILRRFHESHPEGEVDFDKFAANLKEFDDDEDEEFVEAPLGNFFLFQTVHANMIFVYSYATEMILIDSDDEEALESRLGEIDIEDAEKVWDKLTKEEKDDFLRMVKQAQSKGVEVVPEPWYPGQKLVEELPSSSKAEKR